MTPETKAHHDQAEKWLAGRREHYHNPFCVLLRYLVSLEEQVRKMPPVSGERYAQYCREQGVCTGFPFPVPPAPAGRTGDILRFITEFDHACLGRMVQSVFIGLIGFLARSRGEIHLLDFGTGSTCGMYGEDGRFLFTGGDVDTDAVSFWAIDELSEPSGSIFKKAYYGKTDILAFDPGVKFDLITGHHVLEHCLNWESVLDHVAGLLRKDGYLYLSFPRSGGFYDTVYRVMSPHDHRADFDLRALEEKAGHAGLTLCLSDLYVDPNGKFNWICTFYPELVDQEIADCFYELCIGVDAKLLLGYHHYGHYVVFRKTS
ncbi:MAG: class I SAM-dependent methyltransferase [Nitrospirota bacterium]